jgi:hypothetical protein
MALIDFILNLACVLLWLTARSMRFDPLVKTSAASLAGTLRRAEPSRLRSWHVLLVLAGVLVFRALIYSQIGPSVDWMPNLRLGAITIPFRSDMFQRMLLFSLLSFGVTLGIFYLWCLLLSLINGRAIENDSLQKLVDLHLGRVGRWAWPIRLGVPLLVMALLWIGAAWLLSRWSIIPGGVSSLHRLGQGLVIGLGAFLTWKFVFAGFLFLFVLSSYIYFGNQPFWNFVALTGRNMIRPFDAIPLRIGKIDLAPAVTVALVFCASHYAQLGLTLLYRRLP